MNYTIFFVVLLGIGTVVFIGIIGAAWMSAVEEHDPSRPVGLLGPHTTKTVKEFTTNLWPTTTAPDQTLENETEIIQTTTNAGPLEQINSTATHHRSTSNKEIQSTEETPQQSTEDIPPAVTEPLPSDADPRLLFNPREDVYNYSSCNFTELNSTKGNLNPEYNNVDSCTEWLILYEEGYSVDITIEKLILDGESSDFLLISGGPDVNPGEDNIIFTWSLKSKKKYRISQTGMAYILFVTYQSDKEKPWGFQLSYSRAGELSTEEPSTTPSSIPEPPSDTSDTAVMTIKCENCYSDSSGSLYMNKEDERGFKLALANQTNKYCKRVGINLELPAGEENVFILSKWPCVQTWPEHEKCVHLKVAVAVKHSDPHYELTQENLERLWNEWDGEELKAFNLKKLDMPNYKSYVLFWSLGFGLGISLLMVAIFYLWHLYLRWAYKRKLEKQLPEPKTSLEVPPFFNTYEEQIDDPEYLPYYSRYSVGTESSTDDVIYTYDKLPYENPYNGFSFRPQRVEPTAQVNKGFFAEEDEEEYEVMNRNKMMKDLNTSPS